MVSAAIARFCSRWASAEPSASRPLSDRSAVRWRNVLFGALDGMLLYEIESAAETLRDQQSEANYYARHNHEIAAGG